MRVHSDQSKANSGKSGRHHKGETKSKTDVDSYAGSVASQKPDWPFPNGQLQYAVFHQVVFGAEDPRESNPALF